MTFSAADIRFYISPTALLAAALAWFFDTEGIISAFLPSAVVHELGHFAAIKLHRGEVTKISFGLFGLKMDYLAVFDLRAEIAAIAAGPAAGIAFGFFAIAVGENYWSLCGALSIMLSLFNLLPLLPLDGGRILLAFFGQKFAEKLSFISASVLCLAGVICFVFLRSPSLFFMGLWLMICQRCKIE